jgi:hypothetical protein
MKKSSYVVTFSIDDSRWIKSKPISAYTEEQASNILYESASMEGDVSILQIDKMAMGGLTDDEGNLINLKVGDIVVEYKKPNANQPKREMGGQGKIILISDAMAKVEYENNYEEWIPLNDLKKVDSKMANGGKVKFDDKVKSIKASLLKRKKVSPKVQKDYGKTYSPEEAEESAKRIVGSMVKNEKRQPRVSKMLEKMKKGTQLNKKKSTFKDRMKELSTKIKERKSKTTK